MAEIENMNESKKNLRTFFGQLNSNVLIIFRSGNCVETFGEWHSGNV